MTRLEDVIFRVARPEDTDEVVDFLVKNLCYTSPINTSLKFDEEDCLCNYEAKVRHALPDGFSVVAVDKTRNKIVGCTVASRWHRDPAKNLPSTPPATPKTKILYSLVSQMRSLFWELCPPAVSLVSRWRAGFAVRRDLQKGGVGRTMMEYFSSEDYLEAKGVHGTVGVATSVASLKVSLGMGAIPLAEMEYEEFFAANGLPFEGAFTDGTSKAVLIFTPIGRHRHFRVGAVKVKCQRAKL
ncbi:hypothetical protein QR680_013208 [Steinernema hermaphroditum]|uniref:N-acetyltransferase domain-containing protein n=1 Tax=Steinernema hermaphroditum TaxID=289476 RepID=A0AA39M1V6_9BILA|nr:hypothetical protein QR680_013208 [Steinernema hermaphroditum]